MAKRKKKAGGKSRRRRSRMSGMGDNERLMQGLAITGGVILANYLKGFVKPYLTISGKDYSGVAPFALGVMMPKFSKNPMALSVANGMMAEGGASLAAVFLPTLPGMGLVDQIGMGSMRFQKILGPPVNGGNGFLKTDAKIEGRMRGY